MTVSLPLMALVVVTAPVSAMLLSRAALVAAAALLAGGAAARLTASPGTRVRKFPYELVEHTGGEGKKGRKERPACAHFRCA